MEYRTKLYNVCEFSHSSVYFGFFDDSNMHLEMCQRSYNNIRVLAEYLN